MDGFKKFNSGRRSPTIFRSSRLLLPVKCRSVLPKTEATSGGYIGARPRRPGARFRNPPLQMSGAVFIGRSNY